MQWWIGQVTDPDKGEWGDSLACPNNKSRTERMLLSLDAEFVLLDIMAVMMIYQIKIYR